MTEVQQDELVETLAKLLGPDKLAEVAKAAITATAQTVDLKIGDSAPAPVKVPAKAATRTGLEAALAKTSPATARRSRPAAAVPAVTRPGCNQWGYGKAPSLRSANGLGDATGTIKARLNELDNALPGFTGAAFIQHIGVSVVDGSKTTTVKLMEKNPWTWLELPGGKDFSINGTKSREIFTILKGLGYGFSSGNRMWATDSGGNACGRRPGCRVQRIGRAFKDANDK